MGVLRKRGDDIDDSTAQPSRAVRDTTRAKRGVSVSRTRTHLDRLQPTPNSDKLSDHGLSIYMAMPADGVVISMSCSCNVNTRPTRPDGKTVRHCAASLPSGPNGGPAMTPRHARD